MIKKNKNRHFSAAYMQKLMQRSRNRNPILLSSAKPLQTPGAPLLWQLLVQSVEL